ncbi:uncharacterized protein [Henckelia pumila]|uniref:uncharacterized protein n=1 Tax=Henckelia pumila TaxID=405737 RepID=UPI003C6E89F5
MTIEEYQQNFFDLLPYCPHITESSMSKFDHFLQGLNPEIHQMVVVGSDMIYEGLVDRCHQAEDSLRRNRSMVHSFSSRPTSSLGPRGQSFKKQGGTSSSSSRFGGVQRFGSQRMSLCHQCNRRHPAGPCPISASACYQCGQEGHMKRDCPMLIGAASGSRGSQATLQQPPSHQQHQQSQPSPQQTLSCAHSSLWPRVQGQVFALNQEQAEADSDLMIAGTCSLCGFPAYILIDMGASHSFISAHFVKKYRLPFIPLDVLLVVSTPMGIEVLAKRLVVGCSLDFEGYHLSANLMILTLEDFDCIIGIDLLTTYTALVDCY